MAEVFTCLANLELETIEACIFIRSDLQSYSEEWKVAQNSHLRQRERVRHLSSEP